MSLSNWKGVAHPTRTILQGRYSRLEPIDATAHLDGLFAAAIAPGREARFRFLLDDVPSDTATLRNWMENASETKDPLFFVVIDQSNGRAEGRQALMRIDAVNGAIEIGNIM